MKSVRSTDGGSFSVGLRRHASDPRLIRIQVRTLLLTSTKVRPTRLNRHVQSLRGVSRVIVMVIIVVVVVVVTLICPFFSFVSSSARHASLTSCVIQLLHQQQQKTLESPRSVCLQTYDPRSFSAIL